MPKTKNILAVLLLLIAAETKLRASLPCFTVGYTHHFVTTNESSYYGRMIGGKAQSNGFMLAYTGLSKNRFVSLQFASSYVKDSTVAYLGSNYQPTLAMAKYTIYDIGLNFAFSVRQDFNEFMALQFGGGLHYAQLKREILTSGYVYERSISAPGFSTELLCNFRYEFEWLFAFAQFSYMFTINELDLITHRTGFRAGVNVPLRNKEEYYR